MFRLSVTVVSVIVVLCATGCTSGSVSTCDLECSGVCVEQSTDPANCGGCGITCDDGTTCVDGLCECPAGGTCGYGSIDISFSTDFIYSGPLLDAGGSYRWDHMDQAVQTSGALVGIYDELGVVPPAGAFETFSYATRYEDSPGDWRINLQQLSFTDASYNTVMYPEGRMSFYTDSLVAGTLPISVPGPNQPNGVVIYLVTVTANDTCVHAIAHGGMVTITEAVNTTAADGGQLSFEAANVQLYHPTDTPAGDLTAELAAGNLSVCP